MRECSTRDAEDRDLDRLRFRQNRIEYRPSGEARRERPEVSRRDECELVGADGAIEYQRIGHAKEDSAAEPDEE
jgi:hypothetical protein